MVRIVAAWAAACACALAFAVPARAGVIIERASVPTYAGASGDSYASSISADGRFVAFESVAKNLASGAAYANGPNIYLRDRASAKTVLVSRGVGGQAPDGPSHTPAISADGSFVVYASTASNIVATGTATNAGIYVWERATGVTRRVDVLDGVSPVAWSSGLAASASGSWWYPAISADGRYVAYCAPTTVGSSVLQVYRRDMTDNVIAPASLDANSAPGSLPSTHPSISADGARVAFSTASALTATDLNSQRDVYVRDFTRFVTFRASVPLAGSTGTNGASDWPAVSGNGTVVAFTSTSTNLDAAGSGSAQYANVFARVIDASDPASGTTTLVSAGNDVDGLHNQCFNVGIDYTGRYVSFQSDADNVAVRSTAPTYPYYAVFVRDRSARTATPIGTFLEYNPNVGSSGTTHGSSTSLSADGRFLSFDIWPGSKFLSNYSSLSRDVFVADLRVLPKATLSTPKLNTAYIRKNRYYYASGTITRHPNAKAKVQLRFYRKVSGSYRLYKTYTVYTATNGTSYKLKFRLPYTGKWCVRAYHPQDASHLSSYSPYRYFTVYR